MSWSWQDEWNVKCWFLIQSVGKFFKNYQNWFKPELSESISFLFPVEGKKVCNVCAVVQTVYLYKVTERWFKGNSTSFYSRNQYLCETDTFLLFTMFFMYMLWRSFIILFQVTDLRREDVFPQTDTKTGGLTSRRPQTSPPAPATVSVFVKYSPGVLWRMTGVK